MKYNTRIQTTCTCLRVVLHVPRCDKGKSYACLVFIHNATLYNKPSKPRGHSALGINVGWITIFHDLNYFLLESFILILASVGCKNTKAKFVFYI